VLWALERQDEAVDAFRTLLKDEPAAAVERFDDIYIAGLLKTRTMPTPLRRRSRLVRLIELLAQTRSAQGDIVECGCYRGMSSYMMCSYLREWNSGFTGHGYHIFDSFQGLSEPTEDDSIPEGWKNAEGLRRMTQPGSFAASLAEVRTHLDDFPGIAFHPGWIPLTFKRLPERHYRFVHVDVDLYDPTLDALGYFYPRLAPGGILVSDDYSWPGARTATHEYVSEQGIALEITEQNQAVLRKPV